MSTCPNLRKMNLVVHYKTTVVEVMITISLLITSGLMYFLHQVGHTWVWSSLLKLQDLTELDLVTMKLENIRR